MLGAFGTVPHRQHVFVGVINHTQVSSTVLQPRQAETEEEEDRGGGGEGAEEQEGEGVKGQMADGKVMKESDKDTEKASVDTKKKKKRETKRYVSEFIIRGHGLLTSSTGVLVCVDGRCWR